MTLVGVLFAAATCRAFECPNLQLQPTSKIVPSYAASLLWEISGPDATRSYLFGTMHLAAEQTGQPTAAVTAALMRSKQFGMEVVLDLETLMQIGERMRYGDDTTLRSVIGDELFARTARLMTKYGVGAEVTDQLKPWAVYTTLSLPPGQSSTPLDMVLLRTAQHTNKEVFGLETLAEQTAVFDSIDMSQQVDLVADAVCHYTQLHAITDELIEHYRQRDLSAVYQQADRTSSPAQEALNQVLIVARNRRMAERMLPYLERGDAFIAIGALHLPGEDGVLARLVAAGYRVRALSDR